VFFGTPEEFRRCEHGAVRQFLEADLRMADALRGIV